jgi:hypothetical protein
MRRRKEEAMEDEAKEEFLWGLIGVNLIVFIFAVSYVVWTW